MGDVTKKVRKGTPYEALSITGGYGSLDLSNIDAGTEDAMNRHMLYGEDKKGDRLKTSKVTDYRK